MIRRLLLGLLLLTSPVLAAEANGERSIKPIRFAEGKTEAVIEGRIQGRAYVDHTLRAAAGQTLSLQLTARHRALYFNLLPPD